MFHALSACRVLFVLVGVLAWWGVCPSASAQEDHPDDQAMRDRMQAMSDVRSLVVAVTMAVDGSGELPAGFQALADQGLLDARAGTPGPDGTTIGVGPSRYAYLGLEGIVLDTVPDWENLAIVHRDLDQPFAVRPTADNPQGQAVPVGFLDGHVELVSIDEARWLIEDARRTFAALHEGSSMPIHRQVQADAARLAAAMHRYAAEHEGMAPPDWASLEAYLRPTGTRADQPEPPDPAGQGSDAQWLEIFLSPRARASTYIPPFDTPHERAEWINAHSMWRTDTAGVNLWRIPHPASAVLLYARPDAWVEAPDRHERRHVRGLAMASAAGHAVLVEPERLAQRVRASAALYDALRDGTALPPLDNAVHDLLVLARAITDYADEHDGLLPADLGEVLPYIGPLDGIDAAQPARLFLSSQDEREPLVLAEPTPQWVRRHASYVYLGDPAVRLEDLAGQGRHADPPRPAERAAHHARRRPGTARRAGHRAPATSCRGALGLARAGGAHLPAVGRSAGRMGRGLAFGHRGAGRRGPLTAPAWSLSAAGQGVWGWPARPASSMGLLRSMIWSSRAAISPQSASSRRGVSHRSTRATPSGSAGEPSVRVSRTVPPRSTIGRRASPSRPPWSQQARPAVDHRRAVVDHRVLDDRVARGVAHRRPAWDRQAEDAHAQDLAAQPLQPGRRIERFDGQVRGQHLALGVAERPVRRQGWAETPAGGRTPGTHRLAEAPPAGPRG
ncbi:MAG: hypothetical protein KatS3mg103_0672 [Phycisphaerales bacterium]|nr:MAG: hypothetical protein KatS3mg103_0672 [Phycisphaerales bacterium]